MNKQILTISEVFNARENRMQYKYAVILDPETGTETFIAFQITSELITKKEARVAHLLIAYMEQNNFNSVDVLGGGQIVRVGNQFDLEDLSMTYPPVDQRILERLISEVSSARECLITAWPDQKEVVQKPITVYLKKLK